MKVIDKVNLLYGLIVTVLTSIFGKYWFLFLGFFLLNILDYITGVVKAKFYVKNESSTVGAKGVFKKVSYWMVIGIAFYIASGFQHMGTIIGVDLSFLQFFGWFTLAAYIMNEIRSVLENFVEMNIKVPEFLISGLEISQRLMEAKTNLEEEKRYDEIGN